MKPRCYLPILATISIGLLVPSVYAQPSPIHTLAQEIRSTDTGIVAEVDRIAEQITVRIDSRNNGNGSGVIVAKKGNTYYVLTASHVVKNPDRYQIVTSDGQQYPIDSANTTIRLLAFIQGTGNREQGTERRIEA
jgi:S1-C subfamily serine protease